VHRFSTSAKEKAQLQNTWHNSKTICTTAKKMHNGNFPLPLEQKKVLPGAPAGLEHFAEQLLYF
jgi:hypothetical protein